MKKSLIILQGLCSVFKQGLNTTLTQDSGPILQHYLIQGNLRNQEFQAY
jgi:hypothetical protein